ncbi:MAG: TetR/AcrR family transcriptional regulator [Tomitella sp.]|uniref:TetR/AcrR family transcriptional regulator n=1 Tax=Intrasporangium sp. TaxID=1925024 RepID=UPI0026492606|nr:TetR/AcrR family transcriptional regulator [Intrasporangium sp.]MDN5759497.1 TetR/AcrR family transcriptional regulator [Tomitella sp.]MDN5794780.1 TetR/AcrR family transcriptional regulator [Intrasporangium sp.]
MNASVDISVPDGVVREPVQTRAKATFERILQAGLEVLMADGLPGMNTNRIAEVAGVNIATVYAYFTNKESILAFLARRFEDERASWVEEYAAQLGVSGGPTWEQWFSKSIDGMIRFRLVEPGSLAVRRALTAMPELRDLDTWSTQRATEAKVAGLRRIAPKLTQAKARAISHTYTLTVTAVIDEAFAKTPYDRAAIRELKRMIIAYLGSYLPPSETQK